MRRLAVFLALGLALLAPAPASAHPLGNFTINRYSQLELSGNRVYLLYVLDLAEIPTFQERGEVAAQGEAAYARSLAAEIGRGLGLTVGGRAVRLEEVARQLTFLPGVGGLETTRLEVVFAAQVPEGAAEPVRLVYRDGNAGGRIGWKEVTLRARDGAELLEADVPAETSSERLLVYPKDLLQSPLDVTAATASFVPGDAAGPPPPLSEPGELGGPVLTRATSGGGFAKLIAKDDLGAGFVLVSLLLAMFWGAAHALSPGHGKAIVAAYLVGSRGSARQAFALGGIVTVTHTIGVFALGLVTLALSELIVPEQLYPWLKLVSALLVVAVGVSVLRWRLREWRRARPAGAGHEHDHRHHDHHHHDHDHGAGHRHVPASGLGRRGLLGVGISGGIVPCPTALVVLLAAISLHRVGYGLVLIFAFSIGLAVAITGIGLLAVSAKRVFSRVSFESGLVRLLPAVSALVILAFGVAMTVRAVPALT